MTYLTGISFEKSKEWGKIGLRARYFIADDLFLNLIKTSWRKSKGFLMV